MDCNKEDAIRSKSLAEAMMQDNDFLKAHKFLLKAECLCKDLENISQMLAVCDVHCAAQKRLFGNETDWYGILQVVETADDVMIKKQFRKFALLLHPDKNKFPGAESAFKLIREAQTVLLDKTKRSLHDIKRKSFAARPAPPPSRPAPPSTSPVTKGSNFWSQNRNWSRFTGTNANRQDAPQGFSNFRATCTFWTACPNCNIKYWYHVENRDKTVYCFKCSKPFVARDINAQGAPPTYNFSQPVFPKSQDYQAGGKVNGIWNTGKSKADFSQKKSGISELNLNKVKGKKQKKQEMKSNQSCDAENKNDSVEEVLTGKVGDVRVPTSFRRSSRHKGQVSYKEDIRDEENFGSPLKKAKGSGSTGMEEDVDGLKEDAAKMRGQSSAVSGASDQTPIKQKESPQSVLNKTIESDNVKVENLENNDSGKSSVAYADSTSVPGSKPASEPLQMHVCPDPEFNDFDKGRDEICFSEGQIWAVYDNLDVMPRFYAQIIKVLSSPFKVRITWLEPIPEEKNESERVRKDLPIACGKFRRGSSQTTEDLVMFSHLVCWSKGCQKGTYKIFPRKGETWALFRNWDIRQKREPNANHVYEFEFVEIVSEHIEGVGIWVAYLGKLKGFVSLFCRICKDGKEKFLLPPNKLFQFSHSVRSFQLTGEERKGVPKGSLELDPAALPDNVEEIVVPEDVVMQADDVQLNDAPLGYSVKSRPEVGISKRKADEDWVELEPEYVVTEDDSSPSTSCVEDVEPPEPEFFDFDEEKSTGKFCVGQIWSLYSEEEGLPKYYAHISSITNDPFELQVNWLIPCKSQLPANFIQWQDKHMPICCGKFRTSRGKLVSYKSTGVFSHQLKAVKGTKKDVCVIIPMEGQVWALYRDWFPGLRYSELKSYKYDIVEVLEQNDAGFTVLVLEKVDDFNSVFKGRVKRGSRVTMTFSRAELLRFSHQIPAFQLTEENGGTLRGFWELDPLALPVHYFATN